MSDMIVSPEVENNLSNEGGVINLTRKFLGMRFIEGNKYRIEGNPKCISQPRNFKNNLALGYPTFPTLFIQLKN